MSTLRVVEHPDHVAELRAALAADPTAREPATRRALARVMIEEMFQFVGLLTPDGVLVEANTPALSAGGIERDEVIGRPFWHARWWRTSAAARTQLREAIVRAAAGEAVRYDVDVLVGDAGGSAATIDFGLTPVRAADGSVAFLVAEGRDIQAKKAAEAALAAQADELRRVNDRLTELDRLRTDFVANISHELRTPAALVLHDARRLTVHPDADVAQRAAAIADQAAHLGALVDDLLEVARLEHGELALDPRPTDVPALVRRVAEPFAAHVRDRGGRVEVDVPEHLVAELDGEKVETVLRNLLGNAVKFSPRPGHVRCTVRAVGEHLRLEVADDGPGIPEDARELVFERFRQLDGSATREAGGTGIGLSLVRDLVRLHGGTARAAAAPEGGALLVVDLPLRRVADAPPAAPAPPRPASRLGGPPGEVVRPVRTGRPLTLVVDDHADVRRAIAELLGDVDVAQASDGVTGLALARELRPDLVLTDVMMPRSSGEDLLRELRRDPAFDDVPVVVLTARAERDLRLRLLRAGAQDHLVKPFDPDEVRARVANLVRGVVERRRAERAERRFRGMFEHAPHGMVVLDPQGRVVEVNDAFCRLSGHPRAALLGRDVGEVMHADGAADRAVRMAGVLRGEREAYTVERHVRHADGQELRFEVTVSRLHEPGAGGPLLLAQVVDVTARRRMEEELRRLADHDPLTGVANRRAFLARLEHHLAEARRYGAHGALLMLDLDGFKALNDTRGHAAGDAVLMSVAAAMAGRLRESDVLARVGGDEFAVLLPRAAEDDGHDVAEALRAAVAAAAGGVVTASVGVAPVLDGDGATDVLARADLAMYDAKQAGRDRTARAVPPV